MKRPDLHSLVLVLCLAMGACTAPSSSRGGSSARNGALEGCWEGTYHQRNLGIAYPMQAIIRGEERRDPSVTIRWPTIQNTETSGRATLDGPRVEWTEDHLVRGGSVVLGGRYRAAFVASDTLAGVYDDDAGGGGFFALERVERGDVEHEIAESIVR